MIKWFWHQTQERRIWWTVTLTGALLVLLTVSFALR
jgi:hypothetical protein